MKREGEERRNRVIHIPRSVQVEDFKFRASSAVGMVRKKKAEKRGRERRDEKKGRRKYLVIHIPHPIQVEDLELRAAGDKGRHTAG